MSSQLLKTYQEFVRNNALVGVALLVMQAQTFLLVPLIVKNAGPTVYGGFVLLSAVFGVTCLISSLGVGFRARRFLPNADRAEARAQLVFPVLGFQVVGVTFASLVLIGFWPWISVAVLKGAVPFQSWLIAAFLVTYAAYGIFQDYFRYTHRMGYVSCSSVGYAGLTLALIFLSAAFGGTHSLNSLIACQVVSCAIVSAVLAAKMNAEIGVHPKLKSLTEYLSDIRLGLPLVLISVVEIVLSTSDRFIIAGYLSPTEVGYYAPAYSIGSLVIFFPKISGMVLPQALSRALDSGDSDQAVCLVSNSLRAFLFVAIPFCVGSALLGEQLLSIYASQEVALNAKNLVPCLALGMLFYGMNYILWSVLFVRLQTKAILHANLIGASINVCLNLCGLYLFGTLTVPAVSMALSHLVSFGFIWSRLAKDPLLRIDWVGIGKSLVASAMMVAILIAVRASFVADTASVTSLVLCVLLGVMSYGAVFFLIGGVSRKELLFIKQAFAR